MKCDVSVGKKFTFNTGNYSSAGPTLILTVKDVDIEKLEILHEKLDIIADGLYHKQMMSDIKTIAAVKRMGFDEYFNEIDVEGMDREIKLNVKEIAEGSY
jgi:hypothetical protein